jgi:hypothetical protein
LCRYFSAWAYQPAAATIAYASYENATGVLKRKQIQFPRSVFDVEIAATLSPHGNLRLPDDTINRPILKPQIHQTLIFP